MCTLFRVSLKILLCQSICASRLHLTCLILFAHFKHRFILTETFLILFLSFNLLIKGDLEQEQWQTSFLDVVISTIGTCLSSSREQISGLSLYHTCFYHISNITTKVMFIHTRDAVILFPYSFWMVLVEIINFVYAIVKDALNLSFLLLPSLFSQSRKSFTLFLCQLCFDSSSTAHKQKKHETHGHLKEHIYHLFCNFCYL